MAFLLCGLTFGGTRVSLKVRMASHEGSVCLKGVQKCKKLCKCLFGYICKAFGLLIQMDLVQASTDFVSLQKNYRISFKNKLHVFFQALLKKKHFKCYKVIFAKPLDCSSKRTWYRLPQTSYHFEKFTEYHLKINYMFSSEHF